MIVNSTSIGFGKMSNKSPYNLKEKKQIRYIYDIIYNPKATALIKKSKKLGIKTINGLDMNLLQAHFAINKVFKNKIKLNNNK